MLKYVFISPTAKDVRAFGHGRIEHFKLPIGVYVAAGIERKLFKTNGLK